TRAPARRKAAAPGAAPLPPRRRRELPRSRSFAPDLHSGAAGAREEGLAAVHAAGEDLVGERGLDEPLDRLPHGSRSQCELVSTGGDQVIDEPGTGAEGDAALLPQPAGAVREEEWRDLRHLDARARSEHELLVQPSPQLRWKGGARLLQSARRLRGIGKLSSV